MTLHAAPSGNPCVCVRRIPALSNTIVVVAIAMSTSGCGLLTPYDKAEVLDAAAAAPPGLELAGGAEDALRYAEERRMVYYRDLFTSSFVRGTVGGIAVGLSAWTLYNVVKPAGGDSIPIGDRRRTVRLAAALGGLYGLRQLFVNAPQEAIYADGYRELTCLMVQSSPLLMTTRRVVLPEQKADGPRLSAAWSSSLASRSPGSLPIAPIGDVEQLQSDLDTLDAHIGKVRKLVARYDARVDAIAGDSDLVKRAETDLRARSRDTKKALDYATNAYNEGHMLLDAAGQSGYRIRTGAALIVSSNNVAIQKIQADLPDAGTLLKNEQSVWSSVQTIGKTTEADQKDLTTTHAQTVSAADIDMRLASVSGLAAAAPKMMAVAARVGSDQPKETDPAESPKADACRPADAATAACAKTTKKPSATAKAPVAAAGNIPTSADLKKIRDNLDAAIKSIDDAETARKAKADAKALDDKIAKLAALIKERFRQGDQCDKNDACLDNLLIATEELYAARRPVAQALLNFRERARQADATPECADLATLRIAPDGPISAAAGTTVEFLVTQRNTAEKPTAALQGGGTGDGGASLKSDAVPDTKLVKFTLTLGKDMTDQRLRLVFSDSRQLSTQTVFVHVIPKKDTKEATKAADAPTKPDTKS